jgi:DNA integrity scanning protein DisA with diadenylate cyclase activity
MMTWFEMEQIERYLDWLEAQLDQWQLGRFQMRMQKAELTRALHKAEIAANNDTPNSVLREYLLELQRRSRQCCLQIDERLKLR